MIATNLSIHRVQLPLQVSSSDDIRAEWLLQTNSGDPLAFMIVILTNQSLALWTYTLSTQTWIQVSQLDYTHTKTDDFWRELQGIQH